MFGEGGLAEVDGDVAVVEPLPSKCSAKEEVDIAHPIDCNMGSEFTTEGFFMEFVGCVEDKVVNIEADVKRPKKR